jgi:hypothetical protein
MVSICHKVQINIRAQGWPFGLVSLPQPETVNQSLQLRKGLWLWLAAVTGGSCENTGAVSGSNPTWDEPRRSPRAGCLKTSDPVSYSPDDGVSIGIQCKSPGKPSGVHLHHISVLESKFWQNYCAANVFEKPMRVTCAAHHILHRTLYRCHVINPATC